MGAYGRIMKKSDEIFERLDILDILCEKQKVKAELVILGGAAILILMEMNNRTFRPTRDIDVNILSATNYEEIYKLLEQSNIDIVGGVMELPPMEDIRDGAKYKIDLDFNSIKVYVPAIELLACTKIFSKREKDLRDLEESSLLDLCDKNKLIKMVEEYKENMLSQNDIDINVHQLEHILIQKGIL